MSFNIRQVEKWGQDRSNAFVSTAKGIIDDTVSDLNSIYLGLSVCANQLDGIRVRLTDRVLEYTTRAAQEGLKDVFDVVSAVIVTQRDPQPRLWKLGNPHGAFWNGETPTYTDIDANYTPSPRSQQLLFVHGLGYSSDRGASFAGLASAFEKEAQIFKKGDIADLDVLILDYDSNLLEDDRNAILASIYTIEDGVLGPGALDPGTLMLVWGAMWREQERRAGIVAGFLYPLLLLFDSNKAHPGFPNLRTMTVISNSLGSYVVSSALNQGAYLGPPSWWSFEPATLFNSFMSTGDFRNVIGKYVAAETIPLRIWYSYTDIVLSTAYLFAQQGWAMGQIGPFLDKPDSSYSFLQTKDVAASSGISHSEVSGIFEDVPGDYFVKIGSLIRAQLNQHRLFERD